MAEIKTQAYKVGNEFAPYHPQASHVDPSYRDGWNACFAAAEYLRTTSQPVEFSGVAARKLADLQTGGYQIDGYSIQHNVTGQRGFITSGGFVGWWTNMDHIKPAECPATSQPVGSERGGDAVTDAMVDAYLKANDAYWQRTDQLPTPPDKWRTGTPREATRESLRAALAAQPAAQPLLVCDVAEMLGVTVPQVGQAFAELHGARRSTNMEVLPEEAVAIAKHLGQPAAQQGVPGKYDEVLKPFVMLMEKELHANSGKGDRPGWLSMSREVATLEVYYHVAKLAKAARDDDADKVQEHAADVANMAMILADVCGHLPSYTTPQPAQQVTLSPDQLADKCEAWLQAGGASNIVDAFEAGYRECEKTAQQVDKKGGEQA